MADTFTLISSEESKVVNFFAFPYHKEIRRLTLFVAFLLSILTWSLLSTVGSYPIIIGILMIALVAISMYMHFSQGPAQVASRLLDEIKKYNRNANKANIAFSLAGQNITNANEIQTRLDGQLADLISKINQFNSMHKKL